MWAAVACHGNCITAHGSLWGHLPWPPRPPRGGGWRLWPGGGVLGVGGLHRAPPQLSGGVEGGPGGYDCSRWPGPWGRLCPATACPSQGPPPHPVHVLQSAPTPVPHRLPPPLSQPAWKAPPLSQKRRETPQVSLLGWLQSRASLLSPLQGREGVGRWHPGAVAERSPLRSPARGAGCPPHQELEVSARRPPQAPPPPSEPTEDLFLKSDLQREGIPLLVKRKQSQKHLPSVLGWSAVSEPLPGAGLSAWPCGW